MKKKFVTLAMASCLALPLALSLTACGGKKPSKSVWENNFGQDNYAVNVQKSVEGEDVRYNYKVTENGYAEATWGSVDGEYVKETSGAETKYYFQKYDYSNGYAKEEIEASEYVYSHEYFAPILDFVKDNYDKFKAKGTNTYYNGAISAEAKTVLDELAGGENDVYSFVVWEHEGLLVDIIKSDYDTYYELWKQGSPEADELQFMQISGFGEQMLPSTFFYAIKNLTNFKVVGGKDENYMELHFAENAFRYYTPNVVDENGLWDDISVKNGEEYTRYKRSSQGVWSSEAIDKEFYELNVEGLYDRFAIGTIFDKCFMSGNLEYLKKDGNALKYDEIEGDHHMIYQLYYKDIVLNFGDDGALTGASWTLEYRSDIENIASMSYAYTLTVGGVTVETPTI